ncbi:hypothetical protein QKU58_gp016 [Pyramimonas orientalis virus]|uniref:Uncharacterized protein n=1 Tax=Pyramimonas orientalis virus 01B TaxID=3134525 RepID=A0A7M4CEQ0_9VIRU|nr:hypothetical protein QKU58_gp016 [Pyramimonas orientalis virus]QOI90154.1 hypothetical protein HWQ62_00016 [Pyramimonas orientalis virus]
MASTVSTKEVDYLEQDEPIRNQNFVCLSFISPEEILKKKEAFFFEKYTQAYTKKTNEFVDTLSNLFPDKSEEIRILKDNFDFLFDSSKINDSFNYFVKDTQEELDKEFHEQNDFQTSIRGLKVRGVYDTMQEAQARSQKLRKFENNKFSIFVAQVGCWCPWSPNPDNIEDQEFAETELNTLMKKYKENNENKTEFFEARKDEMKQQIAETEKTKKNQSESGSSITVTEETGELTLESDVKGKAPMFEQTALDDDDPWNKRVKEKNV